MPSFQNQSPDRDDLKLAHRLADAAGEAIRPLFRGNWDSERKADSSPVTEADRAAEAAIRAILEAERPDDGILGEEYGLTRENAGRRWVLDPIDGTISFMAGRPIFGTLIALLQDGWPILGVIDQPIGRERWAGQVGGGTTFNGKPVAAPEAPRLFAFHKPSGLITAERDPAGRPTIYTALRNALLRDEAGQERVRDAGEAGVDVGAGSHRSINQIFI